MIRINFDSDALRGYFSYKRGSIIIAVLFLVLVPVCLVHFIQSGRNETESYQYYKQHSTKKKRYPWYSNLFVLIMSLVSSFASAAIMLNAVLAVWYESAFRRRRLTSVVEETSVKIRNFLSASGTNFSKDPRCQTMQQGTVEIFRSLD